MSRFSVNDYTRAMMNLLPSGIAWNRLPDSVQYRLVMALAEAYQRSDADACALIAGAFPETADALTDEWYISLGLDDDCGAVNAENNEEARKYILAKLLFSGGQSVDFFVQLAASLGHDISIREYRVPLCGFSWCGHILARGTNFHWTVVVVSSAEDAADSRYLECIFRKYAPAHTSLSFEYIQEDDDEEETGDPGVETPEEPESVEGQSLAVNRVNFLTACKTGDPVAVNRAGFLSGITTDDPTVVNRVWLNCIVPDDE
ncbi:TPA: DUF2313 domain-containing protein [Escherichia coli]|nr:DUF2313 domain-containing protein [Escherichia coli]